MKHTDEDRADRLMRRKHGWYDRSTLYWAGWRLHIVLRDTERALFSRWGTNVKPDWDAALRPLYLIGLAWMAVVLVLLAGTWLDLWPR